ncbi:MAG: decarboxylating 6-phosphogluconate dehydrogenase [Candidatus Aureabacteria bacterium]|nr:decarboxylating 6-phosphogluconate dehydrogenase [Candidatus Auribacterota bacterium]
MTTPTIGFIGLGKMGRGMAERLIRAGYAVSGCDPNPAGRREARKAGVTIAPTLSALLKALPRPRVVWIMVPAGSAAESVTKSLAALLRPGDTVIDGGNSYYRDSIARHRLLKRRGIAFLDVGTSGGTRGEKDGYCLMAGGENKAFVRVEPVLKALAAREGLALVGPPGSGHFVKMIHNGIEYGMLEAYAEGFEIMAAAKEFRLDLRKIARLWNRGSVVRSWLLELVAGVLAEDPGLNRVCGYVEDSGEGRWTIAEAVARDIPAPVITLALLQRLRSRQNDPFAARLIAALRKEFGGHKIRQKSEAGSKKYVSV